MNAIVVIGIPSLVILLVIILVVAAIRSSHGPHEIIDEMTDPTPAQIAAWERENAALKKRCEDEAAWWYE